MYFDYKVNTWIFQICKKICFLVGFSGDVKGTHLTHTWKIQVYRKLFYFGKGTDLSHIYIYILKI